MGPTAKSAAYQRCTDEQESRASCLRVPAKCILPAQRTTLATIESIYRRATVSRAWRRRARHRRRAVREKARALRSLSMSTSWLVDVVQFRRKG